jgi:hypothetical protein
VAHLGQLRPFFSKLTNRYNGLAYNSRLARSILDCLRREGQPFLFDKETLVSRSEIVEVL